MGKIAVILGLLIGLLALGVAREQAAAPADLVYIEPNDMNTLDPQRMSYNQDFRLSYALYETLVRWDIYSDDFHVMPGAASSWEVSPDRRTYTFRLDPRGKWSSGDPVRAGDFVYSWQRALMPDTAADYSQLFHLIKGGREFFEFRTAQLAEYATRDESQRTPEAARALRDAADQALARLVGLEAIDDLTLRVTLERPTPYFLDLVAFGPFSPVHRATVEAYTDVDPDSGMIRQRHGWTKPPLLVGNGPYVLTKWKFKQELRLEKNPHFRDPGLARAASIRVLCIEDQNTSVLSFKSGAADLHIDLDLEYIGDLLAQSRRGERDDLHQFTTFGTYFWSFNCTPTLGDGRHNPFRDAAVRRAFAMATDKAALVREVRRSEEKVANVIVPPGSIAGYTSPRGLSLDPAAARRELALAGWADRDADGVPENEAGEPFPVVELLCTPVGPHRDIAQAMSRMWEQALGVRTRVVVKETKVYRNTLKRRDYMVARGGWYGDYLDPLTFLDLHRTGDGNNDRGFSDPRYDEMLRAADDELDPARRLELLAMAERYAVEEAMPVLPLYHYDQYYLYRPHTRADGTPNPGGLRGMSKHPRLIQYLYMLEVVGRERPAAPVAQAQEAAP